jgi:murein DD-endopeptidase MepM/ murein hydrolase activator NlpD
MHYGVDFACPTGTELLAISDGVIEDVKTVYIPMRGYGKNVSLRCKNEKYLAFYGHCSKILVKKGQKVLQGQIIAKSGATGYCVSSIIGGKGAHLHFGMKRKDKWVDPLEYMANHLRQGREAIKLMESIEEGKIEEEVKIIPITDGEDEENFYYLVKKGDSLSSIASKFYSNGNEWEKIFKANKETIEYADKIYPNQKLKIPKDGSII